MSLTVLGEITEAAWALLEGELGKLIANGIRGLVEGAEEDLRTFGLFMAQDMVTAIRRGDAAWAREIKAQAKILLEINRLRAVNHNHEVLMNVIHALVSTGLKIVETFVPGLSLLNIGG